MKLIYSVVRLQSGNKQGTGFFIEGNFILTCTHILELNQVINATVCDVQGRFNISIQVNTIQSYPADKQDVTLLEVIGILPPHIQTLRLLTSEFSAGNKFITHGFPNNKNGDHTFGNISSIHGSNDRDFPQVTLDNANAVTRGFSGAPIYDQRFNAVIGMIWEVSNPDKLQRGILSAYGATSDFIADLFPRIKYKNFDLRGNSNSTTLEEKKAKNLQYLLSETEKDEYYALIVKTHDELINAPFQKIAKEYPHIVFRRIITSEKLSQYEINELNGFIKNKNYQWHEKSMVVGALTISAVVKLDIDRLQLLLDFIFYGEEKVWQRALTGLVLGLYNRDQKIRGEKHLIRQIERLKQIDAVQESFYHLVNTLADLKFKEYQEKLEKYKERKKKNKSSNTLSYYLHLFMDGLELAKEDLNFSLFLMLSDHKEDSFFQKPQNWLLPFYKDNSTIIQYFQESPHNINPFPFLEFLEKSYLYSSSNKYSLALLFNKLNEQQFSLMHDLHKLGDKILDKLMDEYQVNLESLGFTVFNFYLRDLYNFALTFPKKELKKLFNHQIILYNSSLSTLITNSQFKATLKAEEYFRKGDDYEKQKNYTLAIAAYEKAVRIQPSHYKAHFALGNIYDKQRKYELAINFYQKAIDIKPDSHEALWGIGLAYMLVEKSLLAIRPLQKAIKIKPSSPQGYYFISLAYINQEDFTSAISALEKAIQISPNYHEAYDTMGLVYKKQGNYSDAITAYQKVIGVKPNEYKVYYKISSLYKKQGNEASANLFLQKAKNIEAKEFYLEGKKYVDEDNYHDAITAYQKAIEIKPDYYEAFRMLGLAYNKQGNYISSIEIFKKVIKIKPDYYEAFGGLGLVYLEQKKYSSSIKAFKQAIKIKPNEDKALYVLGTVYAQQGDYSSALKAYQQAIEINPKNYNALYDIGFIYEKQKDYSSALKTYQQAIEIKSDNHNILYNMGLVYYKQGNYSSAIKTFQQVININPKEYKAFYVSGLAYFKQGNYSNAIEFYQEAIKINPNDCYVLHNMGNAYGEQGNLQTAIECYQKAVEIKSDYYEVFNSMGILYRKQGNYSNAIESYQKAIKINPSKHYLFSNMSFAYYKMGEYEKGVEACQKGLEIVQDDGSLQNNYSLLLLCNQQFEAAKLNYAKALPLLEKAYQVDECIVDLQDALQKHPKLEEVALPILEQLEERKRELKGK